MSFHLLMSSSVSSTIVLWFWMYKYFASLVILILKYFIHYNAIVNRIVFLISFSVCLLLVFRNTTDFCMLILCPTTLLNSSIISNSFFFYVCGIFRVFFIWDHVICRHISSCLPFWCEYLLCPPLVWFWQELEILCWTKWPEWVSLPCPSWS